MRVAAVLMMVALLFPALAYANEVQEGSARAPNESVDLIGGVDLGNRWPIFVDSLGRMRVIPMAFNGSSWDSLRVDASGILRVVNEYPNNLQTVATTLGLEAVTTGLKQIGNAFTAHPYGKSLIRIDYNRTGGSAADTLTLYIYSSDDLSNFVQAYRGEWGYKFSAATGRYYDPIPLRLDITTETDAVFPLPANVYLGRYVAVFGIRDSAGAASSATLKVIHEGRYD